MAPGRSYTPPGPSSTRRPGQVARKGGPSPRPAPGCALQRSRASPHLAGDPSNDHREAQLAAHCASPGRAAPAAPARRRPTALRDARVGARLLGTAPRGGPRADLGQRGRAHNRRERRLLDGPLERDQDGRRTHRAAAPTARQRPRRVAARSGLPRTRHDCVPRRLAARHPHRGPVEPMDSGNLQSGQARGGTTEGARLRPPALVRLAPDPRGPVDPRGRAAGRSLATDVPARPRPPLRRVRPRQTGAGGGRDRRRP